MIGFLAILLLCVTSSLGQGSGECNKVHEKLCHRYYTVDCINGNSERHIPDQEHECKFPALFDKKTLSCNEKFWEVKCENRIEAMDACDYHFEQCNGNPMCRPCKNRYQSCIGQPDGPNSLMKAGRNPTSIFIVCLYGRNMMRDECGLGSDGKQEVFDYDQKRCLKFDDSVWAGKSY